jgi:hypothetical protein
VIRYFLQGKFGPWYEVEFEQWTELTPQYESGGPFQEANLGRWEPVLRAVYIDTTLAYKGDVKRAFGDLIDLIWFPDMRCGDCNGRLIDLNAADPDKRYPSYAHATSMMVRHGAWPVERWED